MRPNLKLYGITDLHFSSTLTLSEDLIAQIREASPPDDDGDSVFLDSYKVDNVSHRASVWAMPRDDGSLRIYFNYEIGKGGKLPKRLPRVDQLFQLLSSFQEATNVGCQVSFQFGRRDKARTIIPLPLKLIESPDVPFDEIDMVHMVKREAEREQYHVLLAVFERGIVRETVYFNHHGALHEGLVDEVIEGAVSISNRFILKGE